MSDLYAIAHYIGELPLLDVDDPQFQTQGRLIARACVTYEQFQMLDETPGVVPGIYGLHYRDARGREWHIKLRRARNHCERFFDELQKGSK